MARLRSSLRLRIGIYYALIALTLLPLSYLLHKTYSEGAGAQITEAEALVAYACGEIESKYARSRANGAFNDANRTKFQDALLEIVLDRYSGVEGGFWTKSSGFQGYAYPSYDGAAAKKDVPRSEAGALSELAQSALASGGGQKTVRVGKREAVVSYACPVSPKEDGLVAWSLMRVPISSGEEFDHLKWAVLALLGLVLLTGFGSARMIYRWTLDLRRLQQSIETQSAETLRELPPSRDPDLQRIVDAFNELNRRLTRARADSDELSRRLAQADRLAMLGGMAAGIAHEIRNPMATVKLRLENASLKPEERLPKVLPVVFEQIARVDRLVEMLLAISKPFSLTMETLDPGAWLETAFPAVRARAASRGVKLEIRSEVAEWRFDPFHLGRAIENILQNAVAFSPEGAAVRVNVTKREERLCIEIRDQGPGIAPADREQLFRPFVSRRTGGTGLGLVLAKEILEAHGGTLKEEGDANGARFVAEVPWPKS